MRRGISIDDLPEKYREQVRRQLGIAESSTLSASGCVPKTGGDKKDKIGGQNYYVPEDKIPPPKGGGVICPS